MKKRNTSLLSGAVLASTAIAASAVDAIDFSAAYTAAGTQMASVVTGGMALIAIGAGVSYGIKMWKRIKGAV